MLLFGEAIQPGPNVVVLLDGKQMFVLSNEAVKFGASVFHRFAEKLGSHIAPSPWTCIIVPGPVQ